MEILSALKPLFYISKIFGAAPFKFEVSNIYLDLAYTKIFIACSFCLRLCIVIAKRNELFLISNTPTTISAVVDTFCFEILCFSSYIWILKKCKTILNILRRFDRLSKFNLINRKELTEIYFYSLVFVIFYHILNLANLTNTFFNTTLSIISIISTLHDFFYSLLPLHLNCQFIFLVAVLYLIYNKLALRLKLYLRYIQSIKNKTPFKNFKKFKKVEKLDILSDCKKFSEVANYLQDLGQDLNDCFSLINLISVVYSFVDSLYASYFSYFIGPIPLVSFFLWISYVQIKVLATVIACSFVKKKADQTAQYLHELLIENEDAEIKEELEIFSLQLVHRKIEFSAWGFFKLDFTLIYSMVGAVTTYIVILMQFQDSSRFRVVKTYCPCEPGS